MKIASAALVPSHCVRAWRERLCTSAVSILMALCSTACSQRVHFLGYDAVTNVGGNSSQTTTAVVSIVEAGVFTDGGTPTTSDEPDSFSSAPTADAAGVELDSGLPVVVLNDPPNVLVDDLDLDPERVVNRTNNVFEQLFFGDPATESIYVENEEDAYVFDVFHDDTRMDAMGYGMLVLPYFDRQAEFDKLWTTIDSKFRYTNGARSGYFHHSCATDFSTCSDDIDSFGVFYVVTALFIAESRWGHSKYGSAAEAILTTMRSKEKGGTVDGVLNQFGDDGLPRRSLFEDELDDVWVGSLMPAFFELWYVNTSDVFWHRAAQASRALLQLVVHPQTGLAPERVDRSGQPTQESPEFREGTYGAGFHMALDHAWVGAQPGYSRSADLLIGFFAGMSPGYPSKFTIEGEALNEISSGALIALNGSAASISTHAKREAMMRATWELPTPTGVFRYYDGMSQLLSLLFLGGELKPR